MLSTLKCENWMVKSENSNLKAEIASLKSEMARMRQELAVMSHHNRHYKKKLDMINHNDLYVKTVRD